MLIHRTALVLIEQRQDPDAGKAALVHLSKADSVAQSEASFDTNGQNAEPAGNPRHSTTPLTYPET